MLSLIGGSNDPHRYTELLWALGLNGAPHRAPIGASSAPRVHAALPALRSKNTVIRQGASSSLSSLPRRHTCCCRADWRHRLLCLSLGCKGQSQGQPDRPSLSTVQASTALSPSESATDDPRLKSFTRRISKLQLHSACRIFIGAALIAVFATAFAQQVSAASQGEPRTIAEGLKSQAFRGAYRRVFAPYLGLRWVSTSVLEEPAKSETLPDGRKVLVFVTCRPHACAGERLAFAFESATGNGWGLIHIKPHVSGDARGEALDAQLVNALERMK
jgi:hypothetical protein